MINEEDLNQIESSQTPGVTSEIAEEEAIAIAEADSKKASSSFITKMLNVTKQKHPRGDETREMVTKIRNGCRKTREEFIRRNIRLAFNLTAKFCRSRGISIASPYFEDLFQEAVMGMTTAMDRYDIERGFEFSTYATHWINQALTRGWVDAGPSTVRKPVHRLEQTRLIARAIRILERENPGRNINDFKSKEIAETLVERVGYMSAFAHVFALYQQEIEDHGEVRPATKAYIIDKMSGYIDDIMSTGDLINDFGRYKSTDQEIETSDGEGSALRDFMTYDDESNAFALSPESIKLGQNERDILSYVVASLTKREREIVRYRFIMDETLESTGEIYNLTRERIRQIQSKAFRKIRYGVTNFRKMKQDYQIKVDPELFFDPFFTDTPRACQLVFMNKEDEKILFTDSDGDGAPSEETPEPKEDELVPGREHDPTLFKGEEIGMGALALLSRTSSRYPFMQVHEYERLEAIKRLDQIMTFNHIDESNSFYKTVIRFFIWQQSQKKIAMELGLNKTTVHRHVRSMLWLFGSIEPNSNKEKEQLRKLVDPFSGKDNRAGTKESKQFRSDNYLQDLNVLLPKEDPITRNGLGHLEFDVAFLKLKLRCKKGEKYSERQEQIAHMYARDCYSIRQIEDMTGIARNNGSRAIKNVILGLGLI